MNLIQLPIAFFLLSTTLASGQQDSTMLLGEVSRSYINQTSHKAWVDEEYNSYHPNPIDINRTGIEIKVFFGSWCGDSRREVPRLLKIADSLGFSDQQVSLIAVNRTLKMYKQSPQHEEKGLSIYRVPSILVYQNGELINRIIEEPKVSLEEDLKTIIMGEHYEPHYSFSFALDHNLEQDTNYLRKISNEIPQLVESSSELLSYALSKFAAGESEKAIKALKSNEKAFPEYHISYKYLGLMYQSTGNKRLALKNFRQYAVFEPTDEYVQQQIVTLK